jgi:HAD superfamily hydrolase (TIGR01509 family)
MIKAVLFDMDGLMVESEMLHYQAYKEVLSQFGVTLTLEDYFAAWGSDKDMCIRFAEKFRTPISFEQLLEQKNTLFREVYIYKVTPQKGLLDLLRTLKENHYLLAVCSSSQMYEIEIVLKAVGARDFFDQIVSAESVENGKPAPDCYLLTAKKLGVDPADCLVLEDAPKGVAAAKAAHMRCFAIPSIGLETADFTKADKIFKTLNEITVVDFTTL